MSIVNLASPTNNTNIFCKNLNAEQMVLTQAPTLDISNSNVLCYNSINGNVEYNNTLAVGDVTNGQNLGTVPVYQGKLATTLQFNGLAANPAQGFSLTPAPLLTGGDITINNGFLNQDVRTSASPNFTNNVSLSGTIGTFHTLTCGVVPSGWGMQHIDTSSGIYRQLVLNTNITANRTVDFPNASGTLALISQVPVVTNTSVVGDLASFSNITGAIQDSGIASANLVTLAGTQTLSNKSLIDNTTKIISNTDATKYLNFAISGNTGTFTTILTSQTGSRFIILPDISGTVIVDSGNQTLQNKSIFNLAGTGTQDSFLNANIKRYYWTVATTNNVATTAITLGGSIPNNTAVTFRTTSQAYCTSGTDATKVASRIYNSAAKNVALTYTVLGNTSVFSQNDSGLNALSVAHVVSGSSILVQVTGLTGDNFTWTGETEIYY